jgi:hypothetical protein
MEPWMVNFTWYFLGIATGIMLVILGIRFGG